MKKQIQFFLTALVLFTLAPLNSVGAPAQTKFPNDTIKFGKSGSSLDKVITFDFGGASNSSVSGTSLGVLQYNKNTFSLGDGVATSKTITANIGAGSANPKIRYDSTGTEWQFANDGVNFDSFGSGSGGGAGINLLKNPGFESGVAQGWSNTGGTFAAVTVGSNLLIGKGSALFTASASGQFVASTLYAVPQGLAGQACSESIMYKGGDANLRFRVVDNSSNILVEQTVVASSITRVVNLYFICPSASTSIQVRVHSVGAAAAIALDQMSLGSNALAQVSQAQVAGVAYFATTASCTFSRTNTALGAFATNANCPGPTIEASSLGDWQTTDTDLPRWTVNNLPPGQYIATVTGAVIAGAPFETLTYALSDGTTTSGNGSGTSANGGSLGGGFTVVGTFTYTSAGSRTFELFGSATANAVQVPNEAGQQQLRLALVRYPLASEQATTAGTSAGVWSGILIGSNIWSTTSASFVDGTNAGTFTLNERANSLFGTVVQATSPRAGVTFTPSSSGDYSVCMTSNAATSNVAIASLYQLWDGTNELASQYNNEANAAPMTLCGILKATGGVSKSVWIRLLSAGGGATAILGPSGAQVDIIIKKLTQQTPAPILVNSVVSPSVGVEQVTRVYVDAAGTIVSQSGSWVSSATLDATGKYTLNVAAGTFSATPTCVCSVNIANASSTAPTCKMDATSPSATVLHVTTAGTGSATLSSLDFNVLCMGPK